MRKNSKVNRLAGYMGEGVMQAKSASKPHSALPFRMNDFSPWFDISTSKPFAKFLNQVQKELRFQFNLIRVEWKRDHVVTILIGIAALFAGAISPEIWNGGDATVSGMSGIQSIGGFQFFQLLVSLLFWCWFIYQAWLLFPVMRSHAISLMVMWNLLMLAQIFFHQENAVFPFELKLSQMMQGTLLCLVVLFFVFFFWKAVIETRNLHVEIHHVHEDVRVMQAEMTEHSLMSWSTCLVAWIVFITISTWSGVHHVSEYGDTNIPFLILHLFTGSVSLPILFFVLWYPQRMLGDNVRVRTRAAVDAELTLEESSTPKNKSASTSCPECGHGAAFTRLNSGEIGHPCLAAGCATIVQIGQKCETCSTEMPNRFECKQCGVNAPALDFFPEMEVW